MERIVNTLRGWKSYVGNWIMEIGFMLYLGNFYFLILPDSYGK